MNKNYTLVVGKGKGDSFTFPIGMVEMEINPFHALYTIRKLAKQIAKHYKIKNGEVVIHSVNFVAYIRKEILNARNKT